MINITVHAGQSFLDLATQYYGAPDAAFTLAEANGYAVTDVLVIGQVLVLPETIYQDRLTLEYYRIKNVLPATDITENEIEYLADEGINDMIIELNFIVR